VEFHAASKQHSLLRARPVCNIDTAREGHEGHAQNYPPDITNTLIVQIASEGPKFVVCVSYDSK
jgi:hypothetical protein